MSLTDLLNSLPHFEDEEILKAFIKGHSILNTRGYKTPICSISGGSDSDIMLDIVHRLDTEKKVHYVWFDTGLEYQATKNHLEYLEKRYDITIERERAIKPIPATCKEYGQPFLSKYVSEQIGRLQKHGFKFEDKPFEILAAEYPDGVSSVKWWCNKYTEKNGFEKVSRYDIGYNQHLKEFLVENPPIFKISSKCCSYAKKNVSKVVEKRLNADLSIVGVRQAEGGIRATAYKNCYSCDGDKIDQWRPVFWFKDDTKRAYEKAFNIKHSDCYEVYGFTRTGCCCCPYGREIEHELQTTEQFEPKLFKAVSNVFKESYEYTRKYKEFYKEQEAKAEQIEGQMSIYDYEEFNPTK